MPLQLDESAVTMHLLQHHVKWSHQLLPHTNVLPAMQTIKAVLAHYKATHEDEQPRIITTGHSLGGALAIVAAVCIAHCIPGYCQESPDYTARKLQTYTFAAPRIGDRTLAEYLSSRLKYTAVQLKNKPDVVPYTPPAGEHMLLLTSSPVQRLLAEPAYLPEQEMVCSTCQSGFVQARHHGQQVVMPGQRGTPPVQLLTAWHAG